jgi:hypothetical protein
VVDTVPARAHYSEGNLNTLTNDPRLLAQFTSFITKYQPPLSYLVLQCHETKEGNKEVNYANAVASSVPSKNTPPAAELAPNFKASSEYNFSKPTE